MLMKRTRVILLLGISVALLAVPSVAHAENTTITVAPAIVSIAAQPGEIVQRELVVTNDDSRALPVELMASPIQFPDIILGVDTKPFDASKWVEFPEHAYVLQSKETKRIKIQLHIPEDASPGGHYAQIAVRGLTFEQLDKQLPTSIVLPEVSTTMLINVAGDVHESLEIPSKNIFPSRLTKGSMATTEVMVANSGNIHDIVAPSVVLVDGSGNEQIIPLQSKLVLPQSATTFKDSWRVPDTIGATKAYIRITYGDKSAVVATPKEEVLITPPLLLTLLRVLAIAAGLYLLLHFRNLRAAWRALWRPNRDKLS